MIWTTATPEPEPSSESDLSEEGNMKIKAVDIAYTFEIEDKFNP